MIKHICSKGLGLALIFTLPLPAWTQQDEEPEERWYKVELLVFSNEAGLAGGGEEWPAAPALAYPENFRFLVDPLQVEANLEGLDASSELSATGVQTITIHTPPEVEEAQIVRLMNVFKINILAEKQYQPQPYNGDVLLLVASEDDMDMREESIAGWQSLVTADLCIETVEGDHYAVCYERSHRNLPEVWARQRHADRLPLKNFRVSRP